MVLAMTYPDHQTHISLKVSFKNFRKQYGIDL